LPASPSVSDGPRSASLACSIISALAISTSAIVRVRRYCALVAAILEHRLFR
jgi:hypothetical protein